MSAFEATKPLECAGYHTTSNNMIDDTLSTTGVKDEDNKHARTHNRRRHGGDCTSDGCFDFALSALLGMLWNPGLGWSTAGYVKGTSDDHETRPPTSSVTGGGRIAAFAGALIAGVAQRRIQDD